MLAEVWPEGQLTCEHSSWGFKAYPLESLFHPPLLLLVTHQGQNPDEDVREVQEHVDRDIDRVVERLVESGCPVQVVDHDGRKQHDADHVQDGDRELVVESQPRQERGGQVQTNQTQQTSKEGSSPHRQVLGHDSTGEAGQQDDSGGNAEGLHDASCFVEGDERTAHGTHGAGADEASHDRHGWVVVGVCQRGPTDRDHHADQHEAEQQQTVVDGEVVGDRSTKRGDGDVERRAQRDDEHEAGLRHGVVAGSALVIQTSVEAVQGVPLGVSGWNVNVHGSSRNIYIILLLASKVKHKF